MSRYYDTRRVFVDLVANRFKEGREDLVSAALPAVNARLPSGGVSIRKRPAAARAGARHTRARIAARHGLWYSLGRDP